ncbi:MAG TPA: GAF domain-containing protein, partial [Bacteroidota bacterium]|nr:GAF domain-containing protein [Bacteroidota bacterium]
MADEQKQGIALPPVAQRAAANEHAPTDAGPTIVPPDSFTGRVSTLHEIALQIDAARSREDIVRVLRDEVRWILPHQVAFACLTDRFRTEYTVVPLAGQVPALREGARLAATAGVSGAVMVNQSPLLVDLDEQPAAQIQEGERADLPEHALAAGGMHTLLVVPLRTGNETVGTLAFASQDREAYGEHDIVLAQLLATQVAIALDYGAMLEDAQRRISQIELVNELAEDLTSTLELDQ